VTGPAECELPHAATTANGWNGGALFKTAANDDVDLGLLASPRNTEPTADNVDMMLASLVQALTAELPQPPVVTPVDAPALANATIGRAVTFTADDGRHAEVRAYYTHHWIVVSLAKSPRGDAVAAAFLASLQLRPLPRQRVVFDVADVARVEVPASAWPFDAGNENTPRIRVDSWYLVPDHTAIVGVRAFDDEGVCARMRLATPTELGPLVDTTFYQGELTSTSSHHTDRGVYYETVREDGSVMAANAVCVEPLVVQVIGLADAAHDPRALVEELAATIAPR
jgi:hypothetical protein